MNHRAYSLLDVKSIDQERRIIGGTASTPELDRVGDSVSSTGMTFRNPLPLLWQHQHDQPVGHATFDPPTAEGVRFTAQIAKVTEPGVLRDRTDLAWQSVREKLVGGVSIGFRALPGGVERMSGGGLKYTATEVLELSLVTVPAHHSATIDVIRSVDMAIRGTTGPLTFGGVMLTKAEQQRLAESVAAAALEYFGPKIREHDEALAEFLKIVRGMHDAQQALADELSRLRRRI